MTDEERLHMITEQLIIVRDNLFRGMSKSIQKLQARAINEVLELPSFTESPQQWIGLTEDERTAIRNGVAKYHCVTGWEYAKAVQQATELKLQEKNA